MKRKNIIAYEPLGRLMQDYGCERVSHEAKVVLSQYLEEYALEIGKLAHKYAAHAGRKTVMDIDVKLAAKNLN